MVTVKIDVEVEPLLCERCGRSHVPIVIAAEEDLQQRYRAPEQDRLPLRCRSFIYPTGWISQSARYTGGASVGPDGQRFFCPDCAPVVAKRLAALSTD